MEKKKNTEPKTLKNQKEMISNIHVETPDGDILKTGTGESAGDSGKKKPEVPDKKDLLDGPKSNPDPFANSNLEDKNKQKKDEGPGTEITDGEAG
jgi:hypothetical protein